MKRAKRLLIQILVLVLLLCNYPALEVKAINTLDELFYVGQHYNYTFLRIGRIIKADSSNKKVAILSDVSTDDIDLVAKAPGKSTITIKGEAYTYTINLTVKKMDVTAKFYKRLPGGNYIIKVTNNTKGFFQRVYFTAVFRSSDGEFMDYDTERVIAMDLIPGKTYYTIYKPLNDCDFDLSKSTLEANNFDTELLFTGIKYTDYSAKIKLTDLNKGVIDSSDSKITVEVKNNSAKAVTALVQVCWYNENGDMVYADYYSKDLKQKGTGKVTIDTPDKNYGAVSYSLAGYAYNVYRPALQDMPIDIPIIHTNGK